MSRTILANVDGFTPVIDAIVDDLGLMSAVVFGNIWRYCQMKDQVCSASLEKIGERIGVDRVTVMRHVKELCEDGYLEDTTPDLRNRPHVYIDTGKAGLVLSLSGIAESNTKQKGDSESNSTVAERNTGDSESHLKKELKKELKDTIERANKKVDTILHFEAEGAKAKANGKGWKGRESFPERLWGLADFCVSMFGAPSSQYLSGWLLEIGDWYDRGCTPAHLEAAKKEMSGWSAKPNTPMGIGNLVRRIIQEGKSNAPAIDQSAVEHTKAVVEEKFAGTYVPRPANIQPPALLKNLAQQKGIRK